MSCEDIPSLLDLQKAKLNADDFGRLMGTGIGTSTNGVTGQVRPNYNKVINEMQGEFDTMIGGMNNEFDAQILNMGFTRIGTFAAGATLTNPRQTLLWDIADGGDGQEYGWSGAFPPSGKIVSPGSTPLTTGGIAVGAWMSRFDPELRDYVADKLVYGPNEIVMGVSGSNSLVRNKDQNRPTRIHQEPHGNLFSGVTYKYDWMFDPYQDDDANYRIFNVYGYIGDPNNTGEGAVAVIGAKSAGNAWGSWPSMHFGFNDDSPGGCAMKVMQFDTSDTVFRTPNKGPWKSGMSVAIGDHVTSSNKIYVAATSGITGTTRPAHGSGTVSDGSVDWTLARIPSAAWVKPCVVIGDRDKMPLFGWGDVRLQLLDDVLLAGGRRISLLDVDNTNTVYLFSPAAGLFDIRMAGGGLIRFDNINKSIGVSSCRHMLYPSVATGILTPDVSSTELVRVSNTVPTDITGFTGTKPNQIFYVESTTANMTTIKASSTLLTKTGADIVMSQFQVLLFKVSHDGIRIVQV